jgi:hypothetical protein
MDTTNWLLVVGFISLLCAAAGLSAQVKELILTLKALVEAVHTFAMVYSEIHIREKQERDKDKQQEMVKSIKRYN